jgi:hypothetical protein
MDVPKEGLSEAHLMFIDDRCVESILGMTPDAAAAEYGVTDMDYAAALTGVLRGDTLFGGCPSVYINENGLVFDSSLTKFEYETELRAWILITLCNSGGLTTFPAEGHTVEDWDIGPLRQIGVACT